MPNETMKMISQSWYINKQRATRVNKAPQLSTSEQELAILKFLKEGKGKRYPQGATLNPAFKDDPQCQDLLSQATTIEVKDG